MAAEIKVPAVGESITEVIISRWLKPEGSPVEKDEPLVALETDKVNVDVPAPATGVLSRILKSDNATAAIGEVIGQIEEGASAAVGQSGAPSQSKGVSEANKQSNQPMKQEAQDARPASAATMPAAARMMAQNDLPRTAVTGTGPGGRVLKEDAQRAVDAKSAVQPVAASGDTVALEQIVPMTPLRRRIAERLVQAQQTAAILTTFNEIDMSQVMQLRKRHQEAFTKKYGVKLGFMSFFVKAAIDALRLYPEINAEIRGTDIVYRNFYDIGVAVGGDRGLVVPVLRKAELLSLAEIESAIGDFVKRAGAGKLKLDELQGGTFTITNGGVYGSLMSTPIINPPQSGILGMHSIVERPIGVEGRIELRPMMYVALSYDHRIVDGRGAVSFLKRVKECVEEPHRMLVEI